MTKVEAIIAVLKEKNGAAPLSYIYEHFDRFYLRPKTKNWQAGIRGVLLRELYQNRYFKRVDTGVYALIGYDDEETIEGERKARLDKRQILRVAKAFITRAPSHRVREGSSRIRIESRAQKERVAALEDYSCQVCGWSVEWEDAKGKKRYIIDIDHIVPKEDGGGEELSNLWALCPNCHRKKTLGVVVIDQNRKQILEKGEVISLHHNLHLWQ